MLQTIFQEIPDKRRGQGRMYDLPNLLLFSVLAIMSGADSYRKIQTFIKTKQPLDSGRVGQPEDLNAAASLLLSDQSKFITGQVLYVDGGWCVSDGQVPMGLQGVLGDDQKT